MPSKRKLTADVYKKAARLIPDDMAEREGACYEYLSAIAEVEEHHESIAVAKKKDDEDWLDSARHELAAAHRRANRQIPKCRRQLEAAAKKLVKAAGALPWLPDGLAKE